MFKLNFPKIPQASRFGLYVLLGYIFFLNVFVIRTTPEVLALEFLIVALLVRGLGATAFFKDWIPFIGLFVLYEFLRGYADDLSPFYYQTLYVVHHLESNIFPVLPTIFLQKLFLQNSVLLDISLFFYSSFFYYSFAVAFLIWIFRRGDFKDYFKRFMFMTYVGLLFYFLFPTAPPWFVGKTLGSGLGLDRPIYEDTVLASFSGLSVYAYFVGGNLVAAMPSMHTAWTFFTSAFLVKRYGKKMLPSFIVPIMVGFSIVLTAEHYLLDVVAGAVLAGLACSASLDVATLPRIRLGRLLPKFRPDLGSQSKIEEI